MISFHTVVYIAFSIHSICMEYSVNGIVYTELNVKNLNRYLPYFSLPSA